MIENIAELIHAKAEELVDEAMLQSQKEHPEYITDHELTEKVTERATSLLMFELGTFREKGEDDVTDQFNTWFESLEHDHILSQCLRYIDELEGIRLSKEDPNMSILDKYLKRHNIDLNN